MTEINRRTVTKGIAWSVPVVAVAGAAPAFATSPGVTFNSFDEACKLPGGSCEKDTGVKKGYSVQGEICVSGNENVDVDFAPFTLYVGSQAFPNVEILDIQGQEPGCRTIILRVSGAESSANTTMTGSVPYTWTAPSGRSGSGTLVINAPSTPVCADCFTVAAAPNQDQTQQPEATTAETAEVQEAAEAPVVEETEAVEAPAVEETQVVEAPAAEVTEEVAVETEAPVATNA